MEFEPTASIIPSALLGGAPRAQGAGRLARIPLNPAARHVLFSPCMLAEFGLVVQHKVSKSATAHLMVMQEEMALYCIK